MSKFFIDRPIVAMVVSILMVMWGGHHHKLPVRSFLTSSRRIRLQATFVVRTRRPSSSRGHAVEQQVNGVTIMD